MATVAARLLEAVQEYPVVASLRKEEFLSSVISSKAQVVLISAGNIFNVCEISQELRRHGKLVLVHIDLIDGLGRDHTAVQFLKQKARVDGVASPSGQLITAARKEGLLTIQRMFAHDSPSIATGINVLLQSKPHFIEILPGLAVLRIMGGLRQHFQQPVIAAGLIRTPEDVRLVLKAGAVAVDTSAHKLWDSDDLQ